MTNVKSDPLAALVDVPVEGGANTGGAGQQPIESPKNGGGRPAPMATNADRRFDGGAKDVPPSERHRASNDDSLGFESDSSVDAGLMDLSVLVDRALAFSERWQEAYRPEIFRVALDVLRGENSNVAPNASSRQMQSSAREVDTDSIRGPAGDIERGGILGPPEKLARALNVDLDAVERTIHFDDAGKFQILGRVPGKAKKEQQTNCALAYLYIKEMALATRLVDIEELRQLCTDQGCYDQANFTANFRRDADAGLLREQGDKNSRTRRYMLTQKGVAAGAELLTELVNQ